MWDPQRHIHKRWQQAFQEDQIHDKVFITCYLDNCRKWTRTSKNSYRRTGGCYSLQIQNGKTEYSGPI